ncbi:Pre-mRNA-splicing factor cwc15 [Purpureocillium lavendulum]|uniref:Pre-mRNA-splicing factor cwc15 n=1 Tax=Purpureocillium lavendulum TaxID=1247861 RepID=A0AB34G0T2_9HYPO|nr:Pre-mRNA-splicing factor cwc15 [Purpureocillium lavendulum]
MLSINLTRQTSPSSRILLTYPVNARHHVDMTTAHRPTFDPAQGKEALRGPAYHQRLLPAHTQLKFRKAGQGGDADDEPGTDLAAELLAAEAAYYAKKNGGALPAPDADDHDDARSSSAAATGKRPLPPGSGGDGPDGEEDIAAKRRRILEESREIDADDSTDEDEEDDSDSDDDDEDAELQRELERVRREREEKKKREVTHAPRPTARLHTHTHLRGQAADGPPNKQEAERAKEEEEARERHIAYGNPLLNKQDFTMKRRWDDDVVFKNQARGTEDKGKKKEFVNLGFVTSLLLLSPIMLLLRQQSLLHLLKGAQDVAVLLVGAVAEADVDLFDGALFLPALGDELVKRLAVGALEGPEGLVRAAEGARAAPDVELVDAVGAAEHLADDARDGRVHGPAADEVDAPRLGGEAGVRRVDELLGAQAHGQRLRLGDDARVRLRRPRPAVSAVPAAGAAAAAGCISLLRLRQVAPVGSVAREAPGAGADVGHRLAEVKVEAELGPVAVGGHVERRRVEDGLVEGRPGVGVGGAVVVIRGGRRRLPGRRQGVADLFAGEAAVLVAQHEHVVTAGGGVVEEVVRAVGLVRGRVHEEGGGGAEGDDGVEGPQREGEDGGRVVAGEGHDAAARGEAVLGDEVGGDAAEVSAAVHDGLPQLATQLVGGRAGAAGGQGEQLVAPALAGHVPEVHAADVADIEGRDGAEEQRGEPRRDEGDTPTRPVIANGRAGGEEGREVWEQDATYVVGAAARHLGQPLAAAGELGVKGIALALGALVLPVGGPVVGEDGGELVDEGPGRVEAGEGVRGGGGPVDAAVLLAGAADGGDAGHGHGGRHGGGEAREDEVERLHPHGDGGVDLARRRPHVHALADAILVREVAVEVDLGLGDRLEIRADDDGCTRRRRR